MKQLFLSMLLLAPCAGYSQGRDTTGGANHIWVERGGTSFQKYLELPLGPVHFSKVDSVGCIYYDALTGSLMVNNGSAWVPVSSGSGGAVNSVFGRAGNVVAQSGDYAAYYQSLLGYTAESVANKATDFTAINNTKYPTTAAVNTQINSALGAYYPASNPSGYTSNAGTVTSVTAGAGLSGGTITGTGTISLPNTGTAGTNGTATQIPVFTTDAQGRVTASTNTAIGTLNQNTTGSAATLTTARYIYGNTFNGSADVAGNIAVAYLNSGTGASSATFWRGDGSWSAPPVTAVNTVTLTNKWWQPRVGSATSSATPTINTDSYDEYDITSQAANITSFTTNLSGTPVAGQILVLQITGSGSYTITWGSSFESGSITLPTAITTTMQGIVLKWNTSTSKWRCAGLY